MTKGQIVYFSVTESFWDKPYVMKRHHVYSYRSVILRGEVIETRGQEFKVKLTDNNNFEKDGETFVFHEGILLSNQNFTDVESLGKWKSY